MSTCVGEQPEITIQTDLRAARMMDGRRTEVPLLAFGRVSDEFRAFMFVVMAPIRSARASQLGPAGWKLTEAIFSQLPDKISRALLITVHACTTNMLFVLPQPLQPVS
jgi:hypothetical protein